MRENKIFVSIASYRDVLCTDTLQHLFKMAKYPERVFVGLCQQNKKDTKEKEECLDKNVSSYRNQIRVLRLDYTEAKGPTYARYLCAQLYDGQDFFMQIDSHCLFVRDWDEKAIQMILLLEQGPSKKVVLSHYPPEYKDYKENPTTQDQVTHITKCFFNDDGILSFHGAVFKKPGPLPRRNAFVAGGFIFVRGSLLKEVPYDPHLPFLFTGEELLLSSRFFTHGWDVFTPNTNLVYHAYTRKGEPKFWDDHRLETSDVHLKVKMLCGLIPHEPHKIKNTKVRDSLPHYGQGSERTLEQFYELIGVDPQLKTVSSPTVEFYCACADMQPFPVAMSLVLSLFLLFLIFVVVIVWQRRSKTSLSTRRK